MKNERTTLKLILTLSALFLATLLGGIFALPSFKASAATGDYDNYPAYSRVGYYAEYLGTVQRQKPEVKTEGIATVFPTYGTTLYNAGSVNTAEKTALRRESAQLLGAGFANISNATYDGMDKDGNLYLGEEKLERTLYRHKASENMYYGKLSDDEDAVVKQITYQSRTSGNHITGLYAPAGEVVTLTMDKSQFEECGGLTVYIGQVFSDGSVNMIGTNDLAVNRMPFSANAMQLAPETYTLEYDEQAGTVTGYFGSFLGGPIYLEPVNKTTFTVTISGGVRYSHFILGYTTQDEFKENSSSSAPYFDLEVWDRGVRHSGPKKFAQSYTYAQLYNAALFWEKVASLSSQFPSASTFDKSCGVSFIYDCFLTQSRVPLNSVNCSDERLTAALDYNTIVNSGCDLLNEYNLRFRSNWGLKDNSATGDAITLIAYSLFTDISSKRSNLEENEGLESLFANLSASFALSRLKGDRESDLPVYATLFHSFGADAIIKVADEQQRFGRSDDKFFEELSAVTGYDMTYYFTKLCKIDISKSSLSSVAAKKLPMFVPAACVYGTGEAYGLGGNTVFTKTMQPYTIEYGASVEIDFDKCLQLPFGFSYKIKGVSVPESGSIERIDSHTYTYTPDENKKESGKIFVKIGIRRDDTSFEVEDKILILEFKQKQTKPHILERVIYTYSQEGGYTDAVTAYNEGYAGYESKRDLDNPDLPDDIGYGSADILPDGYAPDTVIEVKGKYFVPSSGKFRIALRGSGSGALYISSDGNNYELAATVSGSENTKFSEDKATYKDIELTQGRWLYFKEVLIPLDDNSFLCLGIGKFEGESVTVAPLKGAYRNNYFAESEQTFVGDNVYKNLKNSESVNNSGGFTRFSPDEIFKGSTGWTVNKAQSTFGHIYEGAEKFTVEFTFYGTRLAIFSEFSAKYGKYEIYIDGKLAATVDLSTKTEIAALAYFSDGLTADSHTVRLRGVSGKFNIDSVSLRLASTVPTLPDFTPNEDGNNFRKPVDHPDTGVEGGANEDYTGLIVGLSVGGAVLIAGAVVLIVLLKKKRKIK